MLDGYMTQEQYNNLIEYIKIHHKWGKGKSVKYIDATYDFRTNRIFGIKLRGMFEAKDFVVVNENKDKDLESWVYDWLEGKEVL